MITVNQLSPEFDCPVISAIERCQETERNFKKLKKTEFVRASVSNEAIRSKWRENYAQCNEYTVPDIGYCAFNDTKPWLDVTTVHAENDQNENKPDIQPGSVISAIEAMSHNPGAFGVDIRPKVYDNVTKSWVLLDSGSCVINPSFNFQRSQSAEQEEVLPKYMF